MSLTAYRMLEAHIGRVMRLAATEELLHWDLETMLPQQASAQRAEQLAALRTVIHELATDPQLERWIEQSESEPLDAWQRANVREVQRRLKHQRALSVALVEASSRAGAACLATWHDVRISGDFKPLLPKLAEVVRLTRERAAAKAELLVLPTYDALLDELEPGLQAVMLDKLFSQLGAQLPALVEQVIEHQERHPARPIAGHFPVPAQRDLAVRAMAVLGFDQTRGRLDLSAHPFCSGMGDDVRLTTRFRPQDFLSGLFSVIHETGHGLYEQGLPVAWRFQPVGCARGMALHESQSLLMEMQACRSSEFMQWLAPQVLEVLGSYAEGDLTGWSAENLLRTVRNVKKGFIRVEADELTYPLHIILRYKLERALLAGALQVGDLPQAWAEGMQELLGVNVSDHRQGFLQDIHWMDGTFAYFPTYTLGAMAAAQLYDAAVAEAPHIPLQVSQGDFAPLLGWLRTKIHGHASRFSTHELLCQATGRGLDADAYLANLRRRYAP